MKWRCPQCGTSETATATYRGAKCARCKGPLVPDEELEFSFECPFCSADVDASAPRCSACKRSFGVPRCRECGAKITGEEERCMQCHAVVPREPHQKIALHHTCPVCSVPLEETAIGRAVGLSCATCSGVFLEHDVIERWTADRGADAPDDIPYESRSLTDATVRYRRCPRCADWMNRFNFGSASGIILDRCQRDGIWFDGGELRAAIDFARSGKLELATKRVREERKKLAEKRTEQSASGGSIVANTPGHRSSESIAQWAVTFVQWFFGP